MFADRAEIMVRAGKGGDGALGFRHEKYRAKGGADGGDGGRGGSIIFEASHNQNTLSKYRTNRLIEAEAGYPGSGNRKAGRSGQDVTVPVPVGTIIYETPTHKVKADENQIDKLLLADLAEDGQTAIIAQGGRGGFGNAHFISSVRQTPHLAELGEPGEKRKLSLELKLVADVGLVGLPNAGKSTLLSVISNAKPEIADYPFTTIVPNLGVVDFEGETFLVADIPGLIEGASKGKGLGDDFLRHVERTAVVLHLVSAQSADVVTDYRTIRNELKSYVVDLSVRPQIVVLTQIDTVKPAQASVMVEQLQKAIVEERAESPDDVQLDKTVFAISATAHRGLAPLLRNASKLVLEARQLRIDAVADQPKVIINELNFPNLWHLENEPDGAWRLTGQNIEGHGRRTDWSNDDAVERLRDIMRKTGVAKELAKRGAEPGAIIRIGPNELEWL